MSIDIWGPPIFSCGSLRDKMICNDIWIILQGGIRDGHFPQDGLVVTWDIGGTFARDPHNLELVAGPSKIFTTLCHCYNFWAKAAWIHTGIPLGEPIYSITVEIYQKTTVSAAWSTSTLARRTKPSPCGWGIFGWRLFFPVNVHKLTGCPVLMLEEICINQWVSRINY